jgi:hypothetical protein
MALSPFCHSMSWQLATIVLLLLTADRAYAKRKIPSCLKGCVLNDKGIGVCRNKKNEIITCSRLSMYINPVAAPAPAPVHSDEGIYVIDYEYAFDIKDILDEYEHGADAPGSDFPYASSPIDHGGPMAASPYSAEAPGYASSPGPASSPGKSDPFLYSVRRCPRGVPPCRVGCRGGRCCASGNVFFCAPR